MFTGIVEDIGTVFGIKTNPKGLSLDVKTTLPTDDLKPGDSVMVDGACLTVTHKNSDSIGFDASHETVSVTTLSTIKNGSRVHLERALALGGRLGGHLVTGHVDGIGTCVSYRPQGDNLDIEIKVPNRLVDFLVPKGSICVDGVSLTVNQPRLDLFRITLIPHTLKVTHLGQLRPGSQVNLETDLIGKYVHHFVISKSNKGIDESFLMEHGFL